MEALQDDVAKARHLFETAIGLDPKNSLALSGLAMACINEYIFGWTDDPAATRDRANETARQAIAADQNDAWAHAINCFCCTHSLHDYDAALKAGHRAVELNHNLALAAGMLALVYSHLSDYDNALLHAANAERLSPRDPASVWWNLARSWAAINAGRFEESLAWAKKMTESNPEFPTGWRHLVADYDLVIYDQRNHGRNPRHDLDNHCVARMAEDLDLLLRTIGERFGEKPVGGVFHSLSAIVSF